MYTNNNQGFENLGMGFNPQLNNFNKAYTPNKQELIQRDYQNHNDLIHNNVEQDIVNEVLNEYIIHIDGADRDRTIYPNPFRYTVTLGGTGTTHADGQLIGGNPNPRIERNYRNIKQLKIKYVILPKYYIFTYGTSVTGYKTYEPLYENKEQTPDGTFLKNYRYLILRIKELDTDKINSTNSACRPNTFVLYKNNIYSESSGYTDVWIPTQPIITYADTNLKNLNKLSIDILDPSGNQIFIKSYNPSDPEDKAKKMDYDDLNNSNPVTTNFWKYNWSCNVCLELSLVIAENEINIQKSYR
jgi:hypothetical protein